MQILKIKDCVPIEELIRIGFKQDATFDIWGNKTKILTFSFEPYDDCEFCFDIEGKKNRIIHISTMDQTYMPIPNILYYMIKNQMVELVELVEVEDEEEC